MNNPSTMKHVMNACVALGLLTGALPACHREPSKKPDVAVDAAMSDAASVTPVDPQVQRGIVEELARQTADRPTDTPRVEDVLASIEKAGLTIERTQQVLGTVIHAHYCKVAITKVGLSLSICEFDTEAAAKAGKLESETKLKAMPRRTLYLNKKTMLTLILPVDDPKIRAERDQVQKLFAAMK